VIPEVFNKYLSPVLSVKFALIILIFSVFIIHFFTEILRISSQIAIFLDSEKFKIIELNHASFSIFVISDISEFIFSKIRLFGL